MYPTARPCLALAVVSELLIAPVAHAAALERQGPASPATDEIATAWAHAGFRLQLRLGWEYLDERHQAPPLGAYAIAIEPGYRLGRAASLGLGLRYSVVERRPWRGLRWSTTLDFAWHPASTALVGLGVGYAGIVADKALDDSYYVVSLEERTSPPPGFDRIVWCDGDGAVALVRGGYLFALGETFATGPVLQLDVQATRCRGEYIDVRAAAWARSSEWWWYRTIQLTWAFAWR